MSEDAPIEGALCTPVGRGPLPRISVYAARAPPTLVFVSRVRLNHAPG